MPRGARSYRSLSDRPSGSQFSVLCARRRLRGEARGDGPPSSFAGTASAPAGARVGCRHARRWAIRRRREASPTRDGLFVVVVFCRIGQRATPWRPPSSARSVGHDARQPTGAPLLPRPLSLQDAVGGRGSRTDGWRFSASKELASAKQKASSADPPQMTGCEVPVRAPALRQTTGPRRPSGTRKSASSAAPYRDQIWRLWDCRCRGPRRAGDCGPFVPCRSRQVRPRPAAVAAVTFARRRGEDEEAERVHLAVELRELKANRREAAASFSRRRSATSSTTERSSCGQSRSAPRTTSSRASARSCARFHGTLSAGRKSASSRPGHPAPNASSCTATERRRGRVGSSAARGRFPFSAGAGSRAAAAHTDPPSASAPRRSAAQAGRARVGDAVQLALDPEEAPRSGSAT